MKTKNPWWKTGIIYHIYPRSFFDANNDGIGDLAGIQHKLGYLADLGVDAIWLSPIYPSPDVDFGYDVSDYYDIDPKFGQMDDFEALAAAAKRSGIRIILDLVLNHTSDQHPWFIESRRGPQSPFRDWYIWKNPGNRGRRPNNWQSRFGGPAWSFDQASGQYYYHTFFPQQPDLNWRNPDVQREMMKIFRYWMEKGVDGFRLDVFNAYYKHPNFPNNPFKFGIRGFDWQQHIFDCDQPEMLPQLQAIRSLLDSYPEKYVVGETYLDDKGQAAGYTGENLLHGTFNFSLSNAPFRAAQFLKAINGWEKALSGKSWPTQVFNNHDTVRSASRYEKGETDNRLRLAAMVLLTLRGTPYLYYGEEIGMRDIPIPRTAILDPVGKRYWPYYKGRDGSRSPMQWNAGKHAGFSETAPWLPVHKNFRARNAAMQLHDDGSLLNLYRSLIHTRKAHPALQTGSFTSLPMQNKQVLAYLRQTQEESILVMLNFSKRAQTIRLIPPMPNSRWKILLSGMNCHHGKTTGEFLHMHAEEGILLVAEQANTLAA